MDKYIELKQKTLSLIDNYEQKVHYYSLKLCKMDKYIELQQKTLSLIDNYEQKVHYYSLKLNKAKQMWEKFQYKLELNLGELNKEYEKELEAVKVTSVTDTTVQQSPYQKETNPNPHNLRSLSSTSNEQEYILHVERCNKTQKRKKGPMRRKTTDTRKKTFRGNTETELPSTTAAAGITFAV